jgi:hypothetical protein
VVKDEQIVMAPRSEDLRIRTRKCLARINFNVFQVWRKANLERRARNDQRRWPTEFHHGWGNIIDRPKLVRSILLPNPRELYAAGRVMLNGLENDTTGSGPSRSKT